MPVWAVKQRYAELQWEDESHVSLLVVGKSPLYLLQMKQIPHVLGAGAWRHPFETRATV